MLFSDFHDTRNVSPLPLYFPYRLSPYKRFWGRRISTLPTWFLSKALVHSDLAAEYHSGLRAAIRAELSFRRMSDDQMAGYTPRGRRRVPKQAGSGVRQ